MYCKGQQMNWYHFSIIVAYQDLYPLLSPFSVSLCIYTISSSTHCRAVTIFAKFSIATGSYYPFWQICSYWYLPLCAFTVLSCAKLPNPPKTSSNNTRYIVAQAAENFNDVSCKWEIKIVGDKMIHTYSEKKHRGTVLGYNEHRILPPKSRV